MANAKLHHYVPRLLLRRFASDPTERNPAIFRLEKRTGRTIRSSIRNEAAIAHHNRLLKVPGMSPTFIEDTLAMAESRATEPIRKLIDREPLTMMERLDIAFLLHFQEQRTPRGRAWQVFTQEQAAKIYILEKLADPEHVRQFFAKQGEVKIDEEIAAWSAQRRRELESGEVRAVAGHDREVIGMFMLSDEVVPRIAAEFTYVSVRSTGHARFIICDHPLVMVDPSLPPTRGVGWMSSPRTEISLPLDPTTCLVLVRGLPIEEGIDADDNLVLELNLRTYASAEWGIYGPTQAAVQEVRAIAKRQRHRVAGLAPRAPRIRLADPFAGARVPFAVRTLVAPRPARGRRR